MNIDYLNEEICEKGFKMPRFEDVIIIISVGFNEAIYRLFLMVFYLLGCFTVRYSQWIRKPAWMFYNSTVRIVSFHFREWNPISFIAIIVFEALNFIYGKEIISIDVSKDIVIDVDKYNRAYIVKKST